MKLFTPIKKEQSFFSMLFNTKKSTRPSQNQLESIAANYTQSLFENMNFDFPLAKQYAKEMRFNRIIEFNSPGNILKKMYGQANHKSTATDQEDLQIFMYNTRIRGVKSISTLCYFQDKLIHFNYQFENLSKQESIRIQDYLFYKYKLESKNTEEIIFDKNKNFLKINKKENAFELNFYHSELHQPSFFKKEIHNDSYEMQTANLNLNASY
ncbi:hypothetical protein [Flavicella sediminum]|uniref:hypothetical protein n=1 Tax=Flavicella sediminum TaxID=2585141 RepID=UPI00111D4018|nr:hypothetical protein [Flavicella sediminum]